ncbi:hypothetical protein [Nostoc sp. FACHB-133]|uniref:hypothetical protein n=2 Tax=Nostoc TaxID=1177 RepID=UPI001685DCA7|nr:hypothetical protein [Nostoc sp. FACHB-133]MBD2525473.1 hypothetical protein [Nostoc sp. FACHB-133]
MEKKTYSKHIAIQRLVQPFNSVNECLNWMNPPFISVNECLNWMNPPFISVNECLNWMNPPFISVNECLNRMNPPFISVNECLNRMNPPFISVNLALVGNILLSSISSVTLWLFDVWRLWICDRNYGQVNESELTKKTMIHKKLPSKMKGVKS